MNWNTIIIVLLTLTLVVLAIIGFIKQLRRHRQSVQDMIRRGEMNLYDTLRIRTVDGFDITLILMLVEGHWRYVVFTSFPTNLGERK